MHQLLKLNKIEIALFTFMFVIVGMGAYFAGVAPEFFKEVYTVEDGFVETVTVFVLLTGTIVCWSRVIKLKKKKPAWFLICTFILGALYLFGAGEEISWGQRIFDRTSSEFFLKNNTQGETNFHNLEIKLESGKKIRINKTVFGLILGIIVAVYMIILPILYERFTWAKKTINSWAMPMSRWIHVILYLILFAIASITPSHKKGELLEFGGVFIFLCVTLFPRNNTEFS